MIRYLAKLFNALAKRQRSPVKQSSVTKLDSGLTHNLKHIMDELGNGSDVVNRQFLIGRSAPVLAGVIFIDGLVDQEMINDNILQPLLRIELERPVDLDVLEKSFLAVGGLKRVETMETLLEGVLTGDTALLIDGQPSALLLSTKKWEQRGISEPDTEVIVKGARDGFTETLRTNTALLRRRIEHPALRFDTMKIGKKTRTEICVAYIQGVAEDKLVEEVKKRLRRIDTAGILSTESIDQFIDDAPFSPFATVGYTERPDVCAAKLMEGRVAIIVDGTPVVHTVPFLFWESFQSPDDYNFRLFYANTMRWIRYLAFFTSVLLPGVYVALSSYHQELIPTNLLISMAAATEGTPFPAVVEALGMGVVFEILREAGIRLPRPVGQAVSIVGALVIGEATVTAGLVGAPVVIVVALTAIASFLVPSQVESAAFLRVVFTCLAGVFGALGIINGLIFVYIHLASLRSFGVPFLAPVAPIVPADLKDVAVRVPIWMMWTRPKSIDSPDRIRQAMRIRPEVPEEGHDDDRS